MQISDDMVRVAAEAMATEAGDDPRALTYAREMKCTSHDREPKERWEFWVPFARAALSAALDAMWRPISEANKTGLRVTSETFILSHAEKKWIRFGKWYVQEGVWYYSGTNERSQWAQVRGDEPTHFMPLPSPPQEGA